MWFMLEKTQQSYTLSERLLRAIQFTSEHTGENLEDLIEQGAEINQPHGTLLPLHCACMANDKRALKILLERGAEVNSYDGCHRTALHHAVEHTSAVCVRLLLENGANMELGDLNNNTPLHWAAYKNNVSCVRLLLEKNANCNAFDLNLDTPLSWAAMRGNLDSLEVLLEYNARPDTVNYNGYTPLQRLALIVAAGLNNATDDRCFQLLVRALGQFDASRLFLSHAPDGRDHIVPEDIAIKPRALRDQCRFCIRRSLIQCHMPTVVATLPIPERLRSFLLLEF